MGLARAGSWGLAALTSCVVILGVITMGLQVPARQSLPPLTEARSLDYSRLPTGLFGPLRAGFIAQALGLDFDFGVPDGRSFARNVSIPRVVGEARIVVTHPFNNDDFEDAYPIASMPFTARTGTKAAGRQTSEPDDCTGIGGSVWYRFRLDRDLGIMATTFGSNYPTTIGVFTGEDLANLEMAGCNSHALGNARVSFPGKRGQTYYFQVSGPAGGELVFNLDPLGETRRVSVSTTGRESNSFSANPSISADGRYVAFGSFADTLVEGDNNKDKCPNNQSCADVFVHDRLTGKTELVSVDTMGRQGDDSSDYPAISGDGRYVAFWSASPLVGDDTNDKWDVFVHDRVTKETSRVSISSQGRQSGGPFSHEHLREASVSISFDGRLVAFASDHDQLVDDDHNGCTDLSHLDLSSTSHPLPAGRVGPETAVFTCRDVFVRDRERGTTTRVSVSSSGREGQGDSGGIFLSPDGRFAVFSSDAPDLVPGDDNGYRDVFVHDLQTKKTELVSVTPSGRPGDSNSGGVGVRGHNSISSDGRYVAFSSNAGNLVPEDGDPDWDVFLRDRMTGKTLLLSGSRPGETGNHSTISANGRFVAFGALFPVVRGSETETKTESYVYDVWTQTTTLFSLSTKGERGDKGSGEPEISLDGRFIAFVSESTNFAEDDHNEGFDVFVHELGWAR